MGEHYYASDPQTGHERRELVVEVTGERLVFVTDAGVFGKRRLDPGTRLLLESVELPQAGMILDLGCGWGAIGAVVARRAPGCWVYLVDINQRAVELARFNLERNGITNAVALAGDGLAPVDGLRFDLVLTNPPIRAGKAVIYRLMAEAAAHLNPGGRFVAVVGNKQGADSYRAKVREVFGEARDLAKGSGYRVIQGVKGASGKR
ncbi:MAG: class I SAM-dependent methyltransferase [Betaproteobacteria bacterium]